MTETTLGRGQHRLRLGLRTVLLVLTIAAVSMVGPIVAIAADLIRLGPTQVDLGPHPILLAVQVERASASDNNPEYDWYAIRFSVQNNATVPEVHPYSLEVLVRLPNAVTFNWAPANGHPFYQAITREDGPRGFGFALGAAELRVPAGDFRTSSNFNGSSPGGMSTQWMALGEEGLNRVPIFENAVDFVVFGIQVPEGTSLEAQIVVTLTWGYYGPLQAYPVESRTVTEATPFT